MLKPVSKSDIPDYSCKEKSPLRAFSDETVAEFVRSTNPGDLAEVTEAPVEMDEKGVQRLASNLREALYRMERDRDMRKEVRVITRGGKRVFLERLEPRNTTRRYS